MAGDAAGQITASLTLDISKFTKALGEAQAAVGKMQKTASQAVSSGGGGDAAASSAKKAKKATDEQQKSIDSLVRKYKNLVSHEGNHEIKQIELVKGMHKVRDAANQLKSGLDEDSKGYEKLAKTAKDAMGQIKKVAESQQKAAASAESLKRKQEAASAAMRKQIKASILPAAEASPAAAPSRGIQILPAVDRNIATEINKVSQSYTALSNALGAGVIDTKKAEKGYKKLGIELKRLEPLVGKNQAAVNAMYGAMSKSKNTQRFIANQQAAGAAARQTAMTVQRSSSTLGAVFGVLGAGAASSSRSMVMGLTNITEAFQKGQMGGRMLSTFLMGDLMDAMMIGSFAADGLKKSANSMAATMPNVAAKISKVAGIFPLVLMAASALAAGLGYLTSKIFDNAVEAEKASWMITKYRDAIITLEATATMFSTTFTKMLKDWASLEAIDVNKAVTATEALARVSNTLDSKNLGTYGVLLKQVGNSFSELQDDVDDANNRIIDANENLERLLGDPETDKLADAIKKAQEEVRLLGKLSGDSRGQLVEAELELSRLLGQQLDIEHEINEYVSRRARQIDKINNSQKFLLEQISAEQELREKIFYLQQDDEKAKRKAKRDKRVQELLKQFKELEAKAKKFRAQIEKVTGEDGFTTGPMAPMLLKDMIDTEDAMKRLVKKGYPELKKAMAGYNQSVHESEFSKVIDAEAEKVKEITALYEKAAEAKMKLSKASIAQMDKGQKAGLEQDIAGRTKTIDFMEELGVKARHTGNAMDKLATKGIEGKVLPAFLSLGEGMASLVSNMFSGDFSNFYAQIGETLGKAGAQIANLIAPGMGEMLGPVFEAIGSAIGTFFDQMISRIKIPSISDPEKMYGMDEVINAAFEQPLNSVAPLFMELGEVVRFVASNMGGLLADIVTAYGPSLKFLGNVFMLLGKIVFNFIGVLFPAIAQMAHSMNIMATMLSPVLAVLGPVIDMLSVIAIASFSFQAALLMVIETLFQLQGPMVGLGGGIGMLAEVVQKGAKMLGDALGSLFEGFAAIIDSMRFFVDSIGGDWTDGIEDQLSGLATSVAALGTNIRAAGNGTGAFGETLKETIKGLDASNDLRDKENKAASKVLNAPQGFKVEKYRYEAMDPSQSNPFTGSSLDGGGMVVNIENIFVDDGTDLLDQLNDANQNGGLPGNGGF